MKKRRLFLASLAGLGIASFAAGVVVNTNNNISSTIKEEINEFNETTSLDVSSLNGIIENKKLSLKDNVEEILVEPKLGYQIANENNGKVSIRFFAAITTLNVKATWKRAMYSANGDVLPSLKETSKEVTNAYTGIKNGDDVLYATDIEAEDGTKPYKYFVVYALKNIPAEYASYYLDARLELEVDGQKVASKVGSVEAKENGNFFSYEYQQNSQLNLEFDKEHKELSVNGLNTKSSPDTLVVPAYSTNENGRYPVTHITNLQNVSSVSLPETITYISEDAFSKDTVVEADFTEEYAVTNFAPSWAANLKSVSYSKYKVDFNTDGGSNINSQSVKKNNKVKKPANPTKDGYEFDHWELDGKEFDFNTPITGNITLVARYTKDSSTSKGFGGDYTAWSNLRSIAGVSGNTAFGKDVELNGLTFVGAKQRLDSDSVYNSQGATITFTVTGNKNDFHMTATSGSGSTYKFTLTKQGSTTPVYTQDVKKGGSANVDVLDLEAGTYVITTPKADGDFGSLKINTIYYEEKTSGLVEVTDEYVTVGYNTDGVETVEATKIKKGTTLSELPQVTKSGYKLAGWYTDSNYKNEFDINKSIDSNLVLYAKWEKLTEDDKVTVSFVLNVNNEKIDSIELVKGNTINLPSKNINGYRFVGWYTDSNMTTSFVASQAITSNITLYGKYVKQYSITFKDINGNVIETIKADEGTIFNDLAQPQVEYIEGKIFDGWTYEGNDFDGRTVIQEDLVLNAKYKNEDNSVAKVSITANEGLQESAYIEFNKYSNVKNYSIYSLDSGSPVKVFDKNAYLTQSGNTFRFDLFGLTEGTHSFMVVPQLDDRDVLSYGSTATVKVEAYDRSGYAHFNSTEGVGAYNNDGTLKENAIVLYVTDDNKNDVELSYKGITVKGIGNILNSTGQACGESGHETECKKVSSSKTYYGKGNTNQGVLQKLAEDNIPLVVRFVGCVSDSGLYRQGTFAAASTSLIEGLTAFDSNDFGGSEGDNGHMARMKSGKNITFEGVGSDATIDGWGFHMICETAHPELGKSFEVRNLKFINTPEDAIGMEGQQSGSTITASVERCWIHNNEFYCPNITDPAESDKAQGDGSVDFKRGMYFTCSYNYFEGCHKTNLVGSSDSSLQYNLTYHHNFWYMCEARGPLARQANIHMYNNIFYGQGDYAMNTRANAYIFSESNIFYACKNPYRVDGGAIKAYNDSLASALIAKTPATTVTDKSQKVSNSCGYNGVDYSSFELDSKLSYIPTNDYYLQEDLIEARKVVFARCGVAKDSLTNISSVSLSDLSILGGTGLKPTVNNLSAGQTVNPGKISKNMYAFKLTDYAKITISYAVDTDDKTGVLINEAGISMLKASGSVVLAPGTYYIQAYNFQPGSTSTAIQFKEFTINSLKVEAYDSTDFMDQILTEFNNAVAQIPSTISYNDTCYNAINNALNKYESLNSNAKAQASANYQIVLNAFEQYKLKGISYVEGLINNLPSNITSTNSNLITEAREAYNNLIAKVGNANVSNLNKLVEAESDMENIIVDIFVSKVNAIPSTITYTSECDALISEAEAIYVELSADQKKEYAVIDAYNKMTSARSTYNSLKDTANTITITFNVDGNTYSTISVKKGNSFTLPSVSKNGYRLEAWYSNSNFTASSLYKSGDTFESNITLYAHFIEQCTITFKSKDGSKTLATVSNDKGASLTDIPGAEYISGYKFLYWSASKNGSEFDFGNIINSNITLYAVYQESQVSSVNITAYAGGQENIYAEFDALDSITDYNVYVKASTSSSFTKVDKQLIRRYANNYRVDVVGLKAGSYSLKVVPVNGSEISDSATIIGNINVVAHERAGFGFVNGSSSGAYNDDGTLKSDAVVIYVANSNKDTVTYNGYVGIQNIITAMKGQKYIKNPVCIRVIGNILDPANMPNGDLYLDGVKNLTVEGIGNDATMNGFGIVIKNSSNIEIRNLGFMNCNSTEGDDCGLQQANDHVWVHNCDFFYGDAGSDADQAKGDGALDTKKSTYVTHSYNHFFDCGKCNLQGMKSESTSNYITYHHNWYDHSDSRHPRIRTCTVHIYNNYFDGNAKYGVGMTMGGSAFVENNYFRSTATMKPMLTSMQGTDAKGAGTFSGEAGGIIKSYGNKFDGNVSYITQKDNATSFDAYEASSRNEQVPSSYKALSGGTTYNNFDTDSSLMYSYNVESPDVAKQNVTTYAGRVQGGDFKWTFDNSTEDSNYSVIKELKTKLTNYKGTVLEVLGLGVESTTPVTPTVDTSVTDVISLIDNLPSTITLSHQSKVEAAEAAYNKLSSSDQSKVTNYTKLVNARAQLNELLNQQPEDPVTPVDPTPSTDGLVVTDFSSWIISGTTTSVTSGLAAKVYKDNTIVATSDVTVSSISEIVANLNVESKGDVTITVSTSSNKSNWTDCATLTASSNNKNVDVKSSCNVSGPVYVRITITCSKGSSNAKSVTINSLDIH